MEVLRPSSGGHPHHHHHHQDAPIDLSTTARPTLLLTPPWHQLPHPIPTTLESTPVCTPDSTPTQPKYIPIPKKRHCHITSTPTTTTATTTVMPPTPTRCSPAPDPPDSPEVARKRPRLESPPPPDSRGVEEGKEAASSTSGGGAGRKEVGGGAVYGAGSQSAMRRRGSQRWPPCPDGLPGGHLLSTLLRLQAAAAHTPPTPALKDTDALVSAVQQSQLLYYTYCSQLLHALATHQHQEQQPPHFDTQDTHETQDTAAAGHDALSSILRARLHTQELPSATSPVPASPPSVTPVPLPLPLPQPSIEARPASTDSHLSGTLPSSTTTPLEDFELSPGEPSSGGARRRAPRALTGKHVRPGTGASASTLITLRQKLQERQKYRDVYGGDSSQPFAKATKTKSKKR